jgi:hypothetical protein
LGRRQFTKITARGIKKPSSPGEDGWLEAKVPPPA